MEIKSFQEFKNLVELCRKLGVEELKDGPLEIKLSAEALFPKTPYQLKKEAEETRKSIEEAHSNSILEQERALNWSSTISEEAN